MKFRLFIVVVIIGTLLRSVSAVCDQGANQSSQKTDSRSGSITGRIVNESGNPLPNTRVSIYGSGRQAARTTVTTDDAGRFVADDLPRGNYTIVVQANGYVTDRKPGETVHYKPGDTVNLVLRKGGVITGTVTDSDGQPVVCVPVLATLIREINGKRTESVYGFPRYTDDRGVYRLYGLPPGTYIIAAAPKAFRTSGITPYEDQTPSYYPSSTRDTAGEVSIQYGTEASGIDIRYRGENGHSVSGTVVDKSNEYGPSIFSVLLMRGSSNTLEAQISTRPRSGDSDFLLSGIPDGDYQLLARRAPNQSDDGASSKRIPIKVSGRDVTGVAIGLTPLGSLAGRLTLDLSTKDIRCETKIIPAVEETLVSITSEDVEDELARNVSSALLAPDKQGDFVFQGFPAGRYRFDPRSTFDESWYIRAVTVPGPTNTPVDAARNGVVVRSGLRTVGVRVVLGNGAASIRGRVTTPESGAIPARTRVYLVPSEAESVDDTLRYYETEMKNDNSFSVLNIATGRYWLLARPFSDESNPLLRPLAWKKTSREILRREAAAAKLAVELKPCQRVAGYQLRYDPGAKK